MNDTDVYQLEQALKDVLHAEHCRSHFAPQICSCGVAVIQDLIDSYDGDKENT